MIEYISFLELCSEAGKLRALVGQVHMNLGDVVSTLQAVPGSQTRFADLVKWVGNNGDWKKVLQDYRTMLEAIAAELHACGFDRYTPPPQAPCETADEPIES